jgi:flagellar biosynthetic protein FlhB
MYGVDDAISSFLKYVIYIISVVLVIIGVFAIIDLIFIRYNYFKKLMMSIQEVKDEYKNTEGNPEIKQKIKQMQYEMSQRQSMEDTASAKVVITNPDHYAIAIAQEADFENRTFSDPIVVAKGKNENALKIKQIALENKVEIIENKPLARALYKSVEVGQEIPEEFMQIIFDILIQLDYIQTEINKNKK